MSATTAEDGSKPFRTAIAVHARVVAALLLRDIQTRFGASYLGFLMSLLFPLTHIGILLVVFVMLGRQAPIGTDVAIFLTAAILPFVIWSYTHRQVMQAFNQNRALTSFPIVRFFDILIARALVEAVNAVLMVAVVAVALTLAGKDLFIADPPVFFHALVLAYGLGVCTGLMFGLITLLTPAAVIVGFLFIPLYWVTCGHFFIPELLPEQIRKIVAIFPLAHIVDYGRTGIYAAYLSDFWSLSYVYAVIGATLLVALAIERGLRPILSSK